MKIGTNRTHLCAQYEVLTTNSLGDLYENSILIKLGTQSCIKLLVRADTMFYASLCINKPSACMELRMFCRKRRILKQMFPPVAPDRSESSVMTLP